MLDFDWRNEYNLRHGDGFGRPPTTAVIPGQVCNKMIVDRCDPELDLSCDMVEDERQVIRCDRMIVDRGKIPNLLSTWSSSSSRSSDLFCPHLERLGVGNNIF